MENEEFCQNFGMTSKLDEIRAVYGSHSYQPWDGWKLQRNGDQICASV